MSDDDWHRILNFKPSFSQLWRHLPSSGQSPYDGLPDKPAYDLNGHLAHLKKLWRSYPLNSQKACDNHAIDLFAKAFAHRRPWLIAQPLIDCIQWLYERDHIYAHAPPTLEYRPYLERMQLRLNRAFIDAADRATHDFLDALLRRLPDAAFAEAANREVTTLPLYALLPGVKLFPTMLYHFLASPSVEDEPVFRNLRDILLENIIKASGYDPATYDGKRKLVFSDDADSTDEQVLDRYLAGTPFLKLLAAPLPFEIPRDRFRAHGIVLAPPEHGKTQLFAYFIRRFLDEGETGIVVLDPHGDLFKSLKGRTPPERTIILDPSDDPPPLNFFDFKDATEIQVLQTFSYLMNSLTGGLTDKQAGVAPYLLKLLRVIPGANLQTLLDIVRERPERDGSSKFLPYVEKLDPDDANYFKLQFLGAKMLETKDAFAWKLAAALSSDAFKKMFAARHNVFDAYRAMQEKKIVLVKGSENVLGEYGLPVFMQLIVSQFFLAALKRDSIPEKDRNLCIIFADEASHIFNSQTTRILTECRKYGLGFLAATQLSEQIPATVKAAIYGATAIKIAGPVKFADATTLAREMHASAEAIQALKPSRTSAEWMLWYKGLSSAVKIEAPYGALNDLPHYPLPPPHKREEAKPVSEAPQSPETRKPRQRYVPP